MRPTLSAVARRTRVRRDRTGEEHRGEVRGRQFVVPAQLVNHPAGIDVPDPADHVVGHAGDDGAVRERL